MKIAFLYILSLCLLMVGKYTYANDIVQHGSNSRLTAKHIGKMQTIKIANIQQDPTVFTNSTPTVNKETIVSVETEDDDMGFRRKFVLIASYCVLLTNASFLIYFFNYFKRRLYYFTTLFTVSSSKYILQGALRI